MQAGECGQPAQADKRKQHNCGQTGKQNAGRKVPAARPQSDTYQPPATSTLPTHFCPHLFLYREQNLRIAAALLPAPPAPAIILHQPSHRPPFCRPLPPLPRNRHLASSCFTGIASVFRQFSLRQLFSRKLFQLRINLSFRFLHFAIQKCIRISKLFISIRLLAVKHSHHFF